MTIIFWISLLIIFYTYIGYGMVLYVLIKIFRRSKPLVQDLELPTLTVMVAAYNEEDFIRKKIENTLQLEYPSGKIRYIFVTDGSTDRTVDIIKEYPSIQLLHSDGRTGKIAAVHRAMQYVETEVVVFTDANTLLNTSALPKMARHYADKKIGAVSGEKRVEISETADATAAEGFYWKYESKLKMWDSILYSLVGAAGELFSIRTDLYQPVPSNSLLDDFMISMRIAEKGYRILYEPEAYAMEKSSASITEELKRKVRISAGGIQSVIWLRSMLLPFKNPVLTWEYISHRVLRWTITPFLLLLAFVLNIWIVVSGASFLYVFLLVCQVIFYGLAVTGWVLESREIRIKILFIPYYFCLMNYAVIAGIIRYMSTTQTGVWEKAKRKM
ncbi:MAG: glycosyl transferase, group 2 family protein [Sediminibacterium sp.]|nr:glycosyl transferase, group 2 family protein [Sediminibacterium sp.]